ncbi:hypothetical protein NDU88_007518 [Pleurodeles waltl]|uniref:Uncharacterized protein n=1 Tax=Pleurodeles waltl TaxID=8319 RepID=A0AAV7NW72_PLEWA|nr:hypothetical protein NDU88_007518 [Pleurodeles waltl]
MQRQPRPTPLPLSASKPVRSSGPVLSDSAGPPADKLRQFRSISGRKAGGMIHREQLLLSRSALYTLLCSIHLA